MVMVWNNQQALRIGREIFDQLITNTLTLSQGISKKYKDRNSLLQPYVPLQMKIGSSKYEVCVLCCVFYTPYTTILPHLQIMIWNIFEVICNERNRYLIGSYEINWKLQYIWFVYLQSVYFIFKYWMLYFRFVELVNFNSRKRLWILIFSYIVLRNRIGIH